MYIVKTARMGEHKSQLVDLVLESRRPEDWRARASCAGMNPQLFELPDNHRADDLDRLKDVAAGICTHCPVKAECLEDADDLDFKYTIRGGMVPSVDKIRGRPRKKVEDLKAPRKRKLRTAKQYDALIDEALAQKYMLNGFCRNGHTLTRDNVFIRNQSRGGRQGYCATCHRERANRRRAKWCRDNLSS